MYRAFIYASALMALAPTALSHIIMANPKPYGNPTNSPLDSSGSNYPCQVTDFSRTIENKWVAGEQQTLSFSGSAVHGGGSCQISVTTDKAPSKSSKFKVIYSIEGGCPGVNGPSEFPFTVPKDLPNGELSMAWTWMNKVGNREYYMNCAAITVSGGASNNDYLDKLPDMAVANIASVNDCKTTEGSDYTFDDPGEFVKKIGNGPFMPLCGGAVQSGGGEAPAAGAPQSNAGGNNGMYTPPASQGAPAAGIPSQPPYTLSAAPSKAPDLSAGSSTPEQGPMTSTVHTLVTVTAPPAGASSEPVAAPSAPANVSSTDASSAPVAEPSTPTNVSSTGALSPPITAPSAPMNISSISGAPSAPLTAPSSPANISSTPAASPSSAPTGGAPAAGSNGSCSQDGAIVCNGEDQFGLCDHGKVVFQPVAAGTKCQGGQIGKREEIVSKYDYSHRCQRTAV